MDRPLSLTKELRPLAVAGLLTQIRTPIKPQPEADVNGAYFDKDTQLWYWQLYDSPSAADLCIGRCPWQVGDRLYLQEPYEIIATGRFHWMQGIHLDDNVPFAVYLTDKEWEQWVCRTYFKENREIRARWMYKSLTRHWFEVTGVGAERVQDISKKDIFAEGTPRPMSGKLHSHAAIQDFQHLWDSIYGEGAWDKNLWVWKRTIRKV